MKFPFVNSSIFNSCQTYFFLLRSKFQIFTNGTKSLTLMKQRFAVKIRKVILCPWKNRLLCQISSSQVLGQLWWASLNETIPILQVFVEKGRREGKFTRFHIRSNNFPIIVIENALLSKNGLGCMWEGN